MERPIDFTRCSLKRRHLKIPAEIEIGDTYLDLKKYNPPKIQGEMKNMIPETVKERIETGAIILPEEPYDHVADAILMNQEIQAIKKNKYIVE